MISYNTDIIADSSLEWYVDAANTKSYPGSGTTWYDLSGKGRNQTLSGGAAFTTLSGVSCINTSTEGYYTAAAGSTYTLTSNHTLIAWARPLADSQVTTWRTLWRTQTSDHPLLISNDANVIGYYDNDLAGFVSYGINLGTIGKENVWTMFTLVGSGTGTTLHIDDLAYSGSISYNATGNYHHAFGAAAGSQSFGYIALGMLYSRALTNNEIRKIYAGFYRRFGL